jgi:hypothetical protein
MRINKKILAIDMFGYEVANCLELFPVLFNVRFLPIAMRFLG